MTRRTLRQSLPRRSKRASAPLRRLVRGGTRRGGPSASQWTAADPQTRARRRRGQQEETRSYCTFSPPPPPPLPPRGLPPPPPAGRTTSNSTPHPLPLLRSRLSRIPSATFLERGETVWRKRRRRRRRNQRRRNPPSLHLRLRPIKSPSLCPTVQSLTSGEYSEKGEFLR